MTSEQMRYAVESAFDEDFDIPVVSSVKSILEERIPLPFRIQHRYEKDKSIQVYKLEWRFTGKDYTFTVVSLVLNISTR